jgi:hypothetical protein
LGLPGWISHCLLQEEPLVLRSINSKSLLTQTSLFLAHSDTPVTMTGLIDSGCSARAFANRNTVIKYKIATTTLPRPRSLLLTDGKPADTITEYFIVSVAMGHHRELCLFFVTILSRNTPLIFGLPWLQRHNPSIDWTKMTITFTSPYCQTNCNQLRTLGNYFPVAPTIPDPPPRLPRPANHWGTNSGSNYELQGTVRRRYK